MASSLSSKQLEPATYSSPSADEANVPKLVIQKNPSNSVGSSCHFNLHQHEETGVHSIVYCRTTSNKVVHYSPCQDGTDIPCPSSDLKKDSHGSTKQRATALSWLSSLLSRRRKRNGAEITTYHDAAVAMVPHCDGDDEPSWEPPRASSWEQLSSWEKPCIPSTIAEDQYCNNIIPSHQQHEQEDHGSNSSGETCTDSKKEAKKTWPVIRKFLLFHNLWSTGKKDHENQKKKRADAGLSASPGASPAPLPPNAARSERNHICNNSYYPPAYYNKVYSSRPNTPRAGAALSRPNTPRGGADHGLLRFYLAPNSFPVRPRSKSLSRHRRTASLT